MSIQEALERGPILRRRNIISASDSARKLGAESDRIARAIFERSGVDRTLQDLIEIAKPSKPDIKFEEKQKRFADSTVWWILGWNYESRSDYPNQYNFDAISIQVIPFTKEIVIAGEECEILTQSQQERREVVEDAIAQAYNNPGKRGGPPVDIF